MMILKDEADRVVAEAGKLCFGHSRWVFALHGDCPSAGFGQGAKQMQQRALARSTGPQHCHGLAFVECERHTLQDSQRPTAGGVFLVNITSFKDGHNGLVWFVVITLRVMTRWLVVVS